MKYALAVLCGAVCGVVAVPSLPAALAVTVLALVIVADRFADAHAARGDIAQILAAVKAHDTHVDALAAEMKSHGDRLVAISFAAKSR